MILRIFSGSLERVILRAHHNNRNEALYWHLNDSFLGTTLSEHELSVNLQQGKNKLLVMDENGNKSSVQFHVYLDK